MTTEEKINLRTTISLWLQLEMTEREYLEILLSLVKEKIRYSRERQSTAFMRGDLKYWRDLKSQIIKDLNKIRPNPTQKNEYFK